jgi:hypothetical protein
MDIDKQRHDLIEKEQAFESFYAREVLGHRSGYNPKYLEKWTDKCQKHDSDAFKYMKGADNEATT